MKDINRLFTECMNELKGTGLEPDGHITISAKKLEKMFGRCCPLEDGTYLIDIEKDLLSNNLPDDIPKAVIVHEILHADRRSDGHDAIWLEKAKKEEDLLGYIVNAGDTTGDFRSFGWNSFGIVPETAKFIVRCKHCGKIEYFGKKCKRMDDLLNGKIRCASCACRLEYHSDWYLVPEDEAAKWRNGTYYHGIKYAHDHYRKCSDDEIQAVKKNIYFSSLTARAEKYLKDNHEEFMAACEAIAMDGFDISKYTNIDVDKKNGILFSDQDHKNEFGIYPANLFGTEYPVPAFKFKGWGITAAPNIESAVNAYAIHRTFEEERLAAMGKAR